MDTLFSIPAPPVPEESRFRPGTEIKWEDYARLENDQYIYCEIGGQLRVGRIGVEGVNEWTFDTIDPTTGKLETFDLYVQSHVQDPEKNKSPHAKNTAMANWTPVKLYTALPR